MLLPQQSAIEGFLASVPPYAELDQRALKRIARTAAQFEAPRRTVIFRPGESAAGIHILMTRRYCARMGASIPRSCSTARTYACSLHIMVV